MESYTDFAVKIGDKLCDIGENPFANCKIAPMYTFEEEMFNGELMGTNITYTFDLNDNIKIIDGSIYRVVPNGLELICWMGDTRATVADGTVRITAMAFAGSDIQMAILPESLKSIGHKAFFGCDELVFVSFSGYNAPILEEEYDQNYYESMDYIPAKGQYDFPDYYGFVTYKDGIEIVPYFMYNVTSIPSNFFYGANFVNYIGSIDNGITMIRPSNGKNYDSFIMSQYFSLVVDGATAADSITSAAIAAISKIPANAKDIKLEHKPIVEAARAAYEKITSFDQRALVSNELLSILTAAEQRIKNLESTDDNIVDDVTPGLAKKVNKTLIINIIIAAVFLLVVAAFIVVLVIFIKTMKKMTALNEIANKVKEEERQKRLANRKPKAAAPPITMDDVIEKSEPAPKLQKNPFVKIENLIAEQSAKGHGKRMLIAIICSAVGLAIIAAGIIWAVTREVKGPFSEYEDMGYTVSVTFDPNGGSFKGSDSTVIDLYKIESFGEDGIKLLSPDDPRRDKNNALTFTKSGHFLAGWYQTRTPIDESDPSKGYIYSGKWDFDSNTLNVERGYEYSPDESVLTLYAAWIPYYKFEIYTKDDAGADVLIDTVSAINLTIPQWKDGDVYLDMDNFPGRDGYTLDKVYDYFTMEEIHGKPSESGDKNFLTGRVNYETGRSETPVIKLYTTWQDGERYKIYSAKDLVDNANLNGYYEIMADLDFAGIKWPTTFQNGKFSGKIFGNNHKFKNISIETTQRGQTENGIFGSIGENAYIENLVFENARHTIDLMEVVNFSNFGLFAGSIFDGASFKNVSVLGSLLIGDKCAELATSTSPFNIGTISSSGNIDGIKSNVKVEKVNPDNTAFDLVIADDGTVTILPGNN